MLKTVCLARESAPIIWFVNHLHRRHPISLLIVEQRVAGKGAWRKLKRLDLGGVLAGIGHRLRSRRSERTGRQECDRVLGDGWERFHPGIPRLDVTDINSSEVEQALREVGPDVMAVHGTSLVKDHIIEIAPVALNLHWGLSPYYRGGRCTEWALLLRDPFNIGVTIHRLDKRIDGGDVVAQARAEVTARDNVYSINLQLSKLGAGLMSRALDQLARGMELKTYPQDFSQGFLFLGRQWNRHTQRQIEQIQKGGLLATILKRPARKRPLPIIELDDN